MKYFVFLISFFFLFLQGAGIAEETFPFVEGNDGAYALQSDLVPSKSQSDSYILPLNAEHPLEDLNFGDAQFLARQLVMSGRTQRQVSSQSSLLQNALSHRTIMVRIAALEQSAHHLYTTLPCQNWSVSSELYVFGMRRILI